VEFLKKENKMEKSEKILPWRCFNHPDSKILHSWDQKHFVYGDGVPRGTGIKSNHKFECAICGCELASDREGAT